MVLFKCALSDKTFFLNEFDWMEANAIFQELWLDF